MWILRIFLSCSFLSVISPSPLEKSAKLVGSSPSTFKEDFPYVVSLRKIRHNFHFCGGAIIKAQWILSAAHCAVHEDPLLIEAVAGTLSRRASPQATTFAIRRIIVHENYDPEEFSDDLSLLETRERILFRLNVQPIPLGEEFLGGGVSCVLCGWGRTGSRRGCSRNLRMLNLETISNEECAQRLPHFHIEASNLCTFKRRGQGACMGDSGGPLAQGNTLVGVVSSGIACARGFPDVYMRVSYYRRWIEENSREGGGDSGE